MSLLQKIRDEALALRKSRNPAASTLVTLIGELDNDQKNLAPGRSFGDAEVTGKLRKFIKNLQEGRAAVQGRAAGREDVDSTLAKIDAEITLLEQFLPRQMDAGQLEHAIQAMIQAGNTSIGAIMKGLQAEHAGLYDGKMASQIAGRLLA